MAGHEHGLRYTFGDDDAAGLRLRLVADVFAETTRAFLGNWLPEVRGTAVDLGCGPGHSTALLAAVDRGHEVVGLDSSRAFVAAARRAYPDLRFERHDVTEPLPPPAPALVFARLVLAHLPEPATRAEAWARGLRAGGRLLLEEMEGIDARDPTLAEYEERVLAVVAHQGAPMYAGPLLESVGVGGGLRRLESEVRAIAVPVPLAARIYGMNLARWRHDPFAATSFDAVDLDDLAARLERLAVEGAGRVGWDVRHVVVERAP